MVLEGLRPTPATQQISSGGVSCCVLDHGASSEAPPERWSQAGTLKFSVGWVDTLWVHPEGRVIGSIVLSRQNKNYTGSEEPSDALNRKDAFIVLKSEEHEGPKFYNKCAIIRAEL
jgi:hypothetical protein